MADDFDQDPAPRSGGRRPGWPVEPVRVRDALWRRRVTVSLIVLVGASLAFFWAKVVMGYSWESRALLQYEGDLAVGDIKGGSKYALGPAAEALKRRSVLRRIREVSGYEGGLMVLGRSIEYEVDYMASTLRVSVVAGSAEGAHKLAGYVTEVFLEHHAERQARRIELELQRLQKRLEGAQDEAEDARKRYNDFREKHGIAHLTLEQNSMVSSAVDLRSDSELAESEVRAMEARVESLRSQLSTMPKTSVVAAGSDPQQRAYDRVRQELASAQATLSPDHPRVQALQQQANQLGSQARRSGSSGLIGADSSYALVSRELREAEWELAGLRERKRGLEEMALNAQERVDSLSGVEGQALALLAEVQVNEELVQRLHGTEAALEDAIEHPPSGFIVIDPGAVPQYPVSNKQKKVVFVGITGLAVLLALFIAFRREFWGLKVKAPSEIAFWGNGPVVASTPWPTDPRGLDELIAGLDDFAPDARGSFLMVGGTEREANLARELAWRMNSDWFQDVSGGQVGNAPGSTGAVNTPPPPSGPYPVGGGPGPSSAQRSTSTALALPQVQLVRREPTMVLEAWDGPAEGQSLRRSARLADRVIVLVASGTLSVMDLLSVKRRLGRDTGVGFIVLGLPDEFESLPDRVGDVARFWAA